VVEFLSIVRLFKCSILSVCFTGAEAARESSCVLLSFRHVQVIVAGRSITGHHRLLR